MSIGTIIQFSNKDMPSTFVFLNTSFIFSYLTLANGGYIINIKPTANGIVVVPEEKELIRIADDGKEYPMATLSAIAKKIQIVNYLFWKFNRFHSCAGSQLFDDMSVV